MGASIREISHSANEGAKVATQAVQAAQSTADTMKSLGESSGEIGAVVKAITSIAEQTNLLALNATIEAARASAVEEQTATTTEVQRNVDEAAKRQHRHRWQHLRGGGGGAHHG